MIWQFAIYSICSLLYCLCVYEGILHLHLFFFLCLIRCQETQSHPVECDSNITTASCVNTQTTDDSSSSHTATIKCEATFESSKLWLIYVVWESRGSLYYDDFLMSLCFYSDSVMIFFQLSDKVCLNPSSKTTPVICRGYIVDMFHEFNFFNIHFFSRSVIYCLQCFDYRKSMMAPSQCWSSLNSST